MLITFIYMNNKYKQKISFTDSLISNELKLYASILGLEINQLYFIYKGKNLSIKNTQKIKSFKKTNLTIYVYKIKNKNKNNDNLKNIICPICENLTLISFNDDKISLDCFQQNHSLSNLSIDLFLKIQSLIEFQNKCNYCKNKIINYKNFYICSICQLNICPLCIDYHKEKKDSHQLFEYHTRAFQCNIHNNNYISYCNKCNVNLCESCEKEHKKHRKIPYKEIKPNNNKLKEITNDINDIDFKINELFSNLKIYESNFNEYMNNIRNKLNEYKIIHQIIFNLLNNLNNYESIKNVINLKTKKITKEISNYIENIKNKFKYLIEREESRNNENEITIIYRINRDKTNIRLFGQQFVENNKNNFIMIINNKKYEISEYYDLKEMILNKYLIIKLIEIKKINNLSYMFCLCDTLLAIFNLLNLDINDITDISYLFSGCESLLSFPDISKWNTRNVLNMNNIFEGCKSLKSLPDISKWNTSNVINMNNIFSGCESLLTLPDIAKWNTNNVVYMNRMFYKCESLLYLPDISNWNTNNVVTIGYMFCECKSLKYLPNISKWNISNISNMNNMFLNCKLSLNEKYIFKKNNDILSGCVLLDILKLNLMEIFNIKKEMNVNKEISDIYEKELDTILLLNVSKENKIVKIKNKNIFKINVPVLSLISKFGDFQLSSNCIIISKDIIIAITKYIYDEEKGYADIIIPDLDKEYKLKDIDKNKIDLNNFIIENDQTKNISIIKFIHEEFPFNIFFEINSNFDITKEKKYIINNIFDNEEIINYNPGTPIVIKKENKIYLVGIINSEESYYLFNKEELIDLKKKINRINMKYNCIQIEKLNFKNKGLNNDEMNFIFQNNFNNLLYLNLENNNISNEGIMKLNNFPLTKLKYLNLSNNKISDEGLECLNNLSNLNELILLNMNLSEYCFIILQEKNFYNTIEIIECDKEKIQIKNITNNFKGFKLEKLKGLKILYPNINNLEKLFSLEKILFSLKELDFSDTEFGDKEIVFLKNNIHKMKNIQIINFENTSLSFRIYKILKDINDLNIKIKYKKIKNKNKKYNILLGGSTKSGKSSYSNYCLIRRFEEIISTTTGISNERVNPSFDKNIKVNLIEVPQWNEKFCKLIPPQLKKCDGVLLLFDVTSKEDFGNLNYCLSIIKQCFYLDYFPVLLIANKIDLEDKRVIEKELIEFFQIENQLIGYFEVSCKDGRNVIESLDFLIDYIIKKEKENNNFLNEIIKYN